MSKDTPAHTPPEPVTRAGLFTTLRKAIGAVREGLEHATRYRLLTNLNNEELAALGITRKDIPRVAVNGWKR